MDTAALERVQHKLKVQRDFYLRNETESLLGPDPTRTDATAGGAEDAQIKNQSRGSIGNLIISTYQNATGVSSINEGPAVSSLYAKWKSERMDQKLRHLVRDRKVGGVGYLLSEKDESGTTHWKVMSPKSFIVESTDLVNNEYGDHAYYVFEDGGKTYLRHWNSKMVENYVLTDGELVLIDSLPHGHFALPAMAFYDEMLSDGAIHSLMEFIIPSLRSYRQKDYELGSATYWNALKLLLLTGISKNQMEMSPDGEQVINTSQRIERQITTRRSTLITIPVDDSSDNPQKPEIIQTDEANLLQIAAVVDGAKVTLAANARVPVSLFDSTRTAQSAEGYVQEWRTFENTIAADQEQMSVDFISFFTNSDFAEGVERAEAPTIYWKPADTASLLAQGDAVSKYNAAGIPIQWIAQYVLRGFTPEAIQDLLNSIESATGAPTNITDIPFPDTLGG